MEAEKPRALPCKLEAQASWGRCSIRPEGPEPGAHEAKTPQNPKARDSEALVSGGRRRWSPSSSKEKVPCFHLLVLFGSSTDWMVPTHMGEGTSPQAADANAAAFWQHPLRQGVSGAVPQGG